MYLLEPSSDPLKLRCYLDMYLAIGKLSLIRVPSLVSKTGQRPVNDFFLKALSSAATLTCSTPSSYMRFAVSVTSFAVDASSTV